jgi:glutamate-1-semialdehyde 2,1-aminomutase
MSETLSAEYTASSFRKSDELRARAHRLIPAGCHTYSKGDDQFPQLSPGFLVSGKGSTVIDVDGNEFLDWGMGLRSVILGHAYEPVLATVRETIERGCNFTRPSLFEADLAEILVELIPCAEMVKFAKNGSDVTTAAVKLARAYTGRDVIVRCVDHPFFSVDDWFIGDTVVDAGVPGVTKTLTKHFRYNDLADLERVLEENRGKVACIILEAATTEHPQPGFLEGVRRLADSHSTVLIFDEIICGFRWHPRGAQTYYGVTPDLATFGKAISNGFALAALVGKSELMQLGGLHHDKPRVFLLSTTNGGETHALAAGITTVSILSKGEVTTHIWRIGQQLVDGFNRLARELHIDSHARMAGVPCSPYQLFLDGSGKVDLHLRTLYLQEMIRRGVLPPYFAISLAHSEADVERTLDASRAALLVVRQAVEHGTTDGLLIGPAVKPVFRKYN